MDAQVKRHDSLSTTSEMDDIEKRLPQVQENAAKEDAQPAAFAAAAVPDTSTQVSSAKPRNETKPQAAGGKFGGRSLPPDHPMHPSKFTGDKFERQPLLTLLGAFCVMVSASYLTRTRILLRHGAVFKFRMDQL